MQFEIKDEDVGRYYKPEVQNVIKLSMAFAKAAEKAQQDKEDNLVLSPYNALTALSMVAKAAGGETRAEMAKTLFGAAPEDLDAEIAKLGALNAAVLDANKDSVTLKSANAVWTNADLLDLNADYAADLKNEFGADISAESFADPSVPAKINDWARDNTNGLIDNIVERLSPDDFAMIASALYFKGDWTAPFDPADTKEQLFRQDQKKEALTKLMNKYFDEDNSIHYQNGRDFEAVSLGYGADRPTMRMVLVRPKGNLSARDWLAGQANGQVPRFLDHNCYEEAIGHVGLPRMDIKQKHDLVPVLKDSGINAAFTRAADFKKMLANGQDGLYVSEVSHDIVLKTDEKGSEAAAVTAVRMTLESFRPAPTEITVDFDRSFVLAIQDVRTGTPLFIGAVNKPNKETRPAAPKM